MSLSPEFPRLDATFAKPETLLQAPLGFASPLWGFFAAAAMGGSAWWWMTRWAQPQNLEALFGAAATAKTQAGRAIEILPAEVAAPAAEAVADAVATAQEIAEPPVLAQPVGGEAAPIGPAAAAEPFELAPEPAPKARPRKGEPKPQ